MHIVLLILKILLIVVLVLLGLLLCLLLLVLFAPVRYRVYAKKHEDICAKLTARWLGFVLCFSAEYDDNGLGYRLRLFGGTLKSGGAFAKDTGVDSGDEPHDIPDDENIDTGKTKAEVQGEEMAESDGVNTKVTMDADLSDEHETRDEADDRLRFAEEHRDMDDGDRQFLLEDSEFKEEKPGFWTRIGAGIDRLVKAVCSRAHTLWDKVNELKNKLSELNKKKDRYVKLIGNARTKEAYRIVKREIARLLRHIRPTKLNGEIIYGADDPAATGQRYGYMCALFYPIFSDTIRLTPDFDEARLEGEIFARGRIRLAAVCMMLLRVIINKNCRVTYSRFKKISGMS